MNKTRKDEERAERAAKPAPERKPPSRKTNPDEEHDEYALDEVLRDCPL